MSEIDQYATLGDEALEVHAEAISAEQERRANLARIPRQIAVLAQSYRDGGGDEQTLTEALTPGQAAPDGAAADHFDYLPEEG